MSGNRRALARLFTKLEQDWDSLAEIMTEVYPHTGNSYTIGITGPPGAGKSTIVDQLVGIIRKSGQTVGILAVDPTSPFSGGAVLGDRIRMQSHFLDAGVFIRSLATKGAHGGLSRIANAGVKLLDAFGKDYVLIETVGVGQTELDIIKVADTIVVTLVPEAGDSVQAMKAGLMEIADIFVINKADRDGAGQMAAAVKSALSLAHGDDWWKPPIVLTQAHVGDGLDKLYEQIGRHRAALETTNRLTQRRRDSQKQEFARLLLESIGSGVGGEINGDGALGIIASNVEKGKLDPYTAVAQAIADDSVIRQLAHSLRKG